MNVTAQSVGSFLAQLRKAGGLTQPELASRLNRSVTYITRLERAVRGCDVSELFEWAAACGRTIQITTGGLVIGGLPVFEVPPPPPPPPPPKVVTLTDFTDAQLLAEIKRRMERT